MAENLDQYKKQAAEEALRLVTSGMVVGLGSGSTAVHAVHGLGKRLQDGRLQNIVAVTTSEATAREAERWRVPLTTLENEPKISITIDGADEADPGLNLIKGLGGALLREKIVAAVSQRLVIIGDFTKQVSQLGQKAPVPVEVIPFAARPAAEYLQSLGARVEKRLVDAERPFITDEGNIILDCHFGPIAHPHKLAQIIKQQPGVVEHGLFLDLATDVILAGPEGLSVQHREQ